MSPTKKAADPRHEKLQEFQAWLEKLKIQEKDPAGYKEVLELARR